MTLFSLLLAAVQAVSPAPAALPPGTAFGPETVIGMASGNLREWTRPAEGDGVLYVRDRIQRWYRVTLTGPCRSLYRHLDTIAYTTDPTGTFDRFSRLRVASMPAQACGVGGIRQSTAPDGFPKARR